ncbi:uncharacterized protein Or67d isoform X1 [Drosophila pseudoobscura]|uniref:Odorant receptor n=1 Tax=Drosophila pseudoobscura pseudoobscura TaxID=46245 RepID=A0A6I8VKZ3_DROPS|nr:uncharacterized protein LOC4813472 isoform X1 [Drosophila pseudoobscura]
MMAYKRWFPREKSHNPSTSLLERKTLWRDHVRGTLRALLQDQPGHSLLRGPVRQRRHCRGLSHVVAHVRGDRGDTVLLRLHRVHGVRGRCAGRRPHRHTAGLRPGGVRRAGPRQAAGHRPDGVGGAPNPGHVRGHLQGVRAAGRRLRQVPGEAHQDHVAHAHVLHVGVRRAGGRADRLPVLPSDPPPQEAAGDAVPGAVDRREHGRGLSGAHLDTRDALVDGRIRQLWRRHVSVPVHQQRAHAEGHLQREAQGVQRGGCAAPGLPKDAHTPVGSARLASAVREVGLGHTFWLHSPSTRSPFPSSILRDTERIYRIVLFVQLSTNCVSILCTISCIFIGAWPAAPIYLVYSFIVMYSFCGLGTIVETSNEDFSKEIYANCLWYELPVKEQRLVILMLAKSQHEISLTAADVMPLSMSTALQLTKGIYSFSMMLITYLGYES